MVFVSYDVAFHILKAWHSKPYS